MPCQPCMFYVICRFTEAQFSQKPWSFLFAELNTFLWLIWFVVKLPNALMVDWARVCVLIVSTQVKSEWKATATKVGNERQTCFGRWNSEAEFWRLPNFSINKHWGPSRFEWLLFESKATVKPRILSKIFCQKIDFDVGIKLFESRLQEN